ncbi:hypothetical protein G6F32_013696 [Rhizopus arrhizus]|nr:hypothetical protein G6F32_013696 [Rhizopus arrhizus]
MQASSSGYCGGGVFTAATSVGGGGGGAGGSDAPQPARPVAANRDRLSRHEVVLAQAAHGVGGEAHDRAVVVHAQVRMVVLAVGDPGQRVHEGHGGVVILEFHPATSIRFGRAGGAAPGSFYAPAMLRRCSCGPGEAD